MESKALPKPWYLIEHSKATGISVIDANGDMSERHIRLVDVHVLEGWTAPDRPAAFGEARRLADTLTSWFGQGRAAPAPDETLQPCHPFPPFRRDSGRRLPRLGHHHHVYMIVCAHFFMFM